MPKGGKREGAGRPKGSRNVKTVEQVKAIKESGLTPLDYLLEVLRDETNEKNVRMDAATKAAPYVHPRLSAVDHSSKDGTMSPPQSVDPTELSDSAMLEVLNAAKPD